MGGKVFSEEIIWKNINRMVKGWKKKIIIGSNENEDKYKDKDFVVNGEGKIEIKWKNESGDKKEIVKNVNE